MELFFEDDSAPSQWHEFETTMADEVSYLEAMDFVVWAKLAEVSGNLTAASLRHQALRAAHVQASYINFRLRASQQMPWLLLQGDRLQNIRDLAAGVGRADELEYLQGAKRISLRGWN